MPSPGSSARVHRHGFRLALRPRKHLELEVVGQHLLNNHVLQINDQTPTIDLPTEIPRGVYGKVTWQY